MSFNTNVDASLEWDRTSLHSTLDFSAKVDATLNDDNQSIASTPVGGCDAKVSSLALKLINETKDYKSRNINSFLTAAGDENPLGIVIIIAGLFYKLYCYLRYAYALSQLKSLADTQNDAPLQGIYAELSK